MRERQEDKVLNRVDPGRRTFVKRLLTGAAFAAPVLATFTLDALAPSSAKAQCLNCTSDTPEPSTMMLIGTGAVGLGLVAYRKAQRSKNENETKTDATGSTPSE